jgi:hypothetical protein
LKALVEKLAGVEAKVTELTAKTPAAGTAITAEQEKGLRADLTAINTTFGALRADLAAATTAQTEGTTTISNLTAEVVKLRADVADKVKISTAGVAAAAEIAAAQATPAVAATTDVDAGGKSPAQVLQAKLAAEKDPQARVVLARQLRVLRGVSFASQEVKAVA